MTRTSESPVHTERVLGLGPFVFVCEHASNRVPDKYQNLGVTEDVLSSHAAWDIGALELSRLLSERFDSPLIASTVSRLVYDCNRAPESNTAIVLRSEDDKVPGNLSLTETQRQERVEAVYKPFANELSNVLDHRRSNNLDTTLVTIHSFTASMHGKQRVVEIGVLHDCDSRFADQMLAAVPNHSNYKIERNQPYGPDDDVTHTLKHHALPRQINNVMLEVRNDLLGDTESIEQISELLTALLSDALSLTKVDVTQEGLL